MTVLRFEKEHWTSSYGLSDSYDCTTMWKITNWTSSYRFKGLYDCVTVWKKKNRLAQILWI